MKLYPFQERGAEFLVDHQNALLADEMGLGKTPQAIAAACVGLSTILVICPAFLKVNWQRELKAWLPHHDESTTGIAQGGYWPGHAPIVIINYDILHRHYAALRARTWGAIICDEAHYMQSTSARRTQHIIGYKPDDAIDGLRRIPTRRRIALTGTPCDDPMNLWPILCWLDPARWLKRGFDAFERRYCPWVDTPFGRKHKPQNLPELGGILRETIMLRRTKADVLADLPEKRREVVPLALTVTDPTNLRDKGVLAQHRRKLGLLKVDHAAEYVNNCLEQGDKPVVFGYHRDVLAALGKKIGVEPVTGNTPMDVRQMQVDLFQGGHRKVFLGQVEACGTGLTLTAGAHVIFVEDDWRPRIIKQAEDRCHRIGQRQSVLVTHLVVPNSLDERVARALVRKQTNSNEIFGEDEEIVGEVTQGVR